MGITSFGNRIGVTARREKVELYYVFDFDHTETVVYTGAMPVPGPVFVLHFWRRAKDRIMHLLGFQQQGTWTDPTVCKPYSLVHYHRHQSLKQPGHPPQQENEQSQDTTRRPPREQPPDTISRSASIEQMAYRVPLLKIDHGIRELPTLKGQPVHLISSIRNFPKSPTLPIGGFATRRPPVKIPAQLKVPIQKTIDFVTVSNHFEHLALVDWELSGIVKVL